MSQDSSTPLRIPAAQYLRMSKEQQQYSLVNQADAISRYAEENCFEIIQTYSDAGRSGLFLKHRTGLARLLQDVVGGGQPYRTILVYDVSRWGRFQDIDEAAHYEFLCRRAGIPVHYCAEPFPNDGTLPSSIMKALKRAMAGEYSRELSSKVYAGKKRLALLGFRGGGQPGYGLRRMLIDCDRKPKQLLQDAQRKDLTTDRVILVPGSDDEVARVHEIYRLFLEKRMGVQSIVRCLNRHWPSPPGSREWTWMRVHDVLTNPKYAGHNVWGRTSQKLKTIQRRVPVDQWNVYHGAFRAIVDPQTFDLAQRAWQARTIAKSNDQVLEDLRRLLATHGRLTTTLISQTPSVAHLNCLKRRFGSLRRAYELIGYPGLPEYNRRAATRIRTERMRVDLIGHLQKLFPNWLKDSRRAVGGRLRIRFRSGPTISVVVCRTTRTPLKNIRWCVRPLARERRFMTLLCRCNATNDAFQDFYLMPDLDRPDKEFRVKEDDPWLKTGIHLTHFSELFAAVQSLMARGRRRKSVRLRAPRPALPRR